MNVHTEPNPQRGFDIVRTGSHERVGQVYVSEAPDPDMGKYLSIRFGSNHAFPENLDQVRNFLINVDCAMADLSDIAGLLDQVSS